MTLEEMKQLQPGELVRHVAGSENYVVTGNYGNRVTAVKIIDITNPAEWEHVRVDPNPPRRPRRWACGHEYTPSEIGMWGGPYTAVENALERIGKEYDVIIELQPDGTDRVVYRWGTIGEFTGWLATSAAQNYVGEGPHNLPEGEWQLESSHGYVYFEPETGKVTRITDHEGGKAPELHGILKIDVPRLLKECPTTARYGNADILRAGYWYVEDGIEHYEQPVPFGPQED